MVDRLHGAEEGKAAGEKIRVTVYKPETALAPGDRILFPARLRAFSNFNNPGRYDYALAMETRGLSCSASVTEGGRIVPLGKGNLGFPFELLERARKPIREFFVERLSPRNQALFQALILGENRRASGPISGNPSRSRGWGTFSRFQGFMLRWWPGSVLL